MGDTLLIRGTGRIDFQNGDAGDQSDSLFGHLLKLPEETAVYPAHDYNGMAVSTIGEEIRHNPRLQVADRSSYVVVMEGLVLDDPKMMKSPYRRTVIAASLMRRDKSIGARVALQVMPLSMQQPARPYQEN